MGEGIITSTRKVYVTKEEGWNKRKNRARQKERKKARKEEGNGVEYE